MFAYATISLLLQVYLFRRISHHDSIGPGRHRARGGDDEHAARRHPPRDVHHGGRSRQRRLLHARARAAAGEEDGQPGRPDRLPPLLRGRARERGRRHHVLRVPRRPPRPRRRGHGAHGHLPRRLGGGADVLGGAPRGGGHRHHTRARQAPLRGPGGARARAGGLRRARRAARRASPRDPGRARAAGIRRRPRVRARIPERSRSAARGRAGLLPDGRSRLGGSRRGPRRPLRLRRPSGGRGRPGRRHRPPRRVGVDDGGPRGLAAPGDRGRHARHAGDRPVLVPLGLLP